MRVVTKPEPNRTRVEFRDGRLYQRASVDPPNTVDGAAKVGLSVRGRSAAFCGFLSVLNYGQQPLQDSVGVTS